MQEPRDHVGSQKRMHAGPARLAAAGVFAASLGGAAFLFAFPLMAQSASLSLATLGTGFSLYFLARLLCAPAAGLLADRFGARALLVPAALCGAALPLAYALFPSLAALFITQFGLGICGAAIRPLGAALVAAGAPQTRAGQGFGIFNALIQLAFFLGPICGGLLFYRRSPLPVAFFLAACMAAACLAFALLPGRDRPTKRPSTRKTDPGHGKRRDALFILPAIAGRTVQAGALMTFYPLLLAERLSGGPMAAGLLYAAPSLAACLALPLAGRLADGRDKIALSLGGMLAGSLALALAASCRTPWGFLACGLAMGLGAALSLPASMALTASCGPDKGRLMGLAHGAAGLGFILGPMLGAMAIKSTGGLDAALFAAAMAGMALCLPLAAMALERRLHYAPAKAWALACLALSPCLALAPLAMGAGGPSPGTGETGELVRYTETAMGTVVNLTIESPDRETADRAAKRAFDRIRELQADLDHRNPYGSIGRINLAAGKRPVRVSAEAYGVIERALTYSRHTEGVFDPAVGAATVAPLYFAEPENILRSKRALVDYRLAVLDPAAQSVFLPKEGMALDLGGLAKGRIVDLAAEGLLRDGVKAGIVEAGGDFYAFGDRDWTAGIQNPRREGLIGTVRIKGRAMCGSGDYQQYVEAAGKGAPERRHHILDPRSMAPAGASIGVTVIAPRAEEADALATALFALGPEKGRKVLAEYYPEASALWVLPNLEIEQSRNFPPLAPASLEHAP